MANEYSKKQNNSDGNRKVFTWGAWIKRSTLPSSNGIIFSSVKPAANTGGQQEFQITLNNSNQIFVNGGTSGSSTEISMISDIVIRDISSFFHLLVAVNSTNDIAQERVKVYVNGALITDWGTYTACPLNYDTAINRFEHIHTLGGRSTSGNYFNGTLADVFFVDGQALTPDVFGFYKDGDGYISVGSTRATDFRPGQWVPKTPRVIKSYIERAGGFGVNGFYLPMNDSSNFGADFHTTPNSIITLKGEDLPQPKNGAPTTTDAYVSQLRTDPYAANLVLAVPGISTSTSANLVTNGTFDPVADGETGYDNGDGTVDGWNKNSIGSLSITSGIGSTVRALRVSQPSANPGVTYGQGSISLGTLTSGKRYLLKYSGLGGTAKKYPAICTDPNTSNTDGSFTGLVAQIGAYSTSAEEVQKYFQPSSTAEHWLVLQLGNDGAGTYHDFDNIVVVQEDAPRDYSADIKGSGTNKTLTANGNAGIGYEIPSYYGSSMIFDGAGGDRFAAPNSADFQFGSGDFTAEAWINPETMTDNYGVVGIWNATDDRRSWLIYIPSDTYKPYFIVNETGSGASVNTQSGVAVTTGQWTHLAAEKKGTKLTIYVNGVATGVNTVAPASLYNNSDDEVQIGGYNDSFPFKGYIQDVRVYKGVAKYQGGFDVLKPYAPVGIATWRAVPDSTANNFATLNPLRFLTSNSLSDGNLQLTSATTAHRAHTGTVGFGTTGKYYAECRVHTNCAELTVAAGFGLADNQPISYATGPGNYVIYSNNNSGRIVANSTTLAVDVAAMVAGAGDIYQLAYDAGTGRAWVGKDNTWFDSSGGSSGDPAAGTNNTFTLNVGFGTTAGAHVFAGAYNNTVDINFGQNPTFSGNTAAAATFTDGNGKGLFRYEPPTGFLALCEDNLPTPAIKNPGEYFKTVLYAGDGTDGKNIVGVGFTPDLVWVKARNQGYNHGIFDSVRGSRHTLYVNLTNDEDINGPFSFNADGFSLSSNWNNSSTDFVAWCWRAGAGTTSTNTDGSINSVVSVNQDAGFSIASFNTTGSAFTLGHGLGKAPDVVIARYRDSTSNWFVYHSGLNVEGGEYLQLNLNAAKATTFDLWSSTRATSSVASFGAAWNSSKKAIAYMWTEIPGFSKFGSYTGNGDADGVFIYTGFKPAFLMVKRVLNSDAWLVMDSVRSSTNPVTNTLATTGTGTENVDTGGVPTDFLSNGFKCRGTGGDFNGSGEIYVYMAFAESPFTTANAK